MVGRVAAARKAVELGYAIEADDGPSGRLGHWRIVGIPEALCVAFSKRAAEIDTAVAGQGHGSLRARGVAARDTRRAKRHIPVQDLMAGWQRELGVTRLQPGRAVGGDGGGRPHPGSRRLGDASPQGSWSCWPNRHWQRTAGSPR